MFRFFHITKKYPDGKGIFDISFDAQPGIPVVLSGHNGCGKTTVLRIIARLCEADRGELLWQGKPLETYPLNLCGFLPEERSLFADCTVKELLEMAGRIRGLSGARLRERIESTAERFNAGDIKWMTIRKLSKGNAQIASLMCAWIHEPQFLLLDEPMSGLDREKQEKVTDLIREYARDHVVILSSHEEWMPERIRGKRLLLENGRIKEAE